MAPPSTATKAQGKKKLVAPHTKALLRHRERLAACTLQQPQQGSLASAGMPRHCVNTLQSRAQ